MKRALSGLIASAVLLIVAFLPPVVEAAERSENIHFGEHLLILLAGLLLAYAAQLVIRSHLALNPSHVQWGNGIAAFGLLLFLASQVPAVDALADAEMTIHVLQHLVILLSGGLMGTGLLVITSGSAPTRSSRSR